MATFMGMEANPPADPALNPAPANLHSMLSQLPSTHSPTVIIIWDFKPSLHGLSSTWKGNIISNILSEINFPLIQRCGLCKLFMGEWVVWKRMCQRFDTGFFFFAKRKKKHPPLLLIVLHSQRKSRGRVNAVILFRGQRGATHTLCASRTCTWLPSFSQLFSTDPHFWKKHLCAQQQHAFLEKTLKRHDTRMHTLTQLHILRHRCISQTHPIPNTGAYVDFCCDQIKQESGQHFGKGRAFHGTSDWPVLGKRSANNLCHWAVMDGVAGVGHRPRSQDRRPFHSAMVTIMVIHSDTCLEAALALGKENRKWCMGQLLPELILLISRTVSANLLEETELQRTVWLRFG